MEQFQHALLQQWCLLRLFFATTYRLPVNLAPGEDPGEADRPFSVVRTTKVAGLDAAGTARGAKELSLTRLGHLISKSSGPGTGPRALDLVDLYV